MISVKTNAREIARSIRAIPKRVIAAYKQSIKEIAQEGKSLAKSLAPVKSGELKRGIYYRIVGNKAELISSVSGSAIPYNLWVNQTAPFRVLHFKRRNRFFKTPQNVVYGKRAISRSGHAINWTGTPGYFDIAYEYMNKRMMDNLNPKIEKALRR